MYEQHYLLLNPKQLRFSRLVTYQFIQTIEAVVIKGNVNLLCLFSSSCISIMLRDRLMFVIMPCCVT